MSRPTPATILFLLTALAARPLPAASEEGRSFSDEISITEVEIPVRVLHRGEPVRGLTAEDFVVLDRGEPREIVGFRVIDLATREPGRPARGAPREPSRAGSWIGTTAPGEGRNILLLFDFVFSRRHKLEQALTGAEEMLAHQLHPADRIAIAYLTGGGANLILGFTEDRREIGLALDVVGALLDRRTERARARLAELDRASGPGGDRPRTRAAELNSRFGAVAAVAILGGTGASTGLEVDPDGGSPFGSGPWGGVVSDPGVGGFGDPVVDQVGSRDDEFLIGQSLAGAGLASTIRTVAREIDHLGTLLRGVSGQKEMLYLSEGFAAGVFDSPQRPLVLRYLERMLESLRRAGWTLHAVDVGGIPNAFGERGFDAESLFYMANETGGLTFENYNRIHRATDELIERTSVTYVLSVRPGELAADGRFHPIEVRLADPARKGRVLHRPGYYAPKPSAAKSGLERRLDTAELLLGKEELDELGVRIRTDALPGRDGLAPVPVVIEVPTAGRAAGGASRTPLELELQAYAVDPRGGVQDLWLRRLTLDRGGDTGDTLARGGLRVLGALAVPPGEYRVRVLVRSPADGRMSLSTIPLEVPAAPDGLLPLDPVVVDRSGDWVEVVALPEGPGEAAGEGFSLGGRPVVPPVAPEIAAGSGLEVLIAADRPESGAPELRGRVLDREGRPAAAVLELSGPHEGAADGLVLYHGWVPVGGLAPGTYRLEVEATGPGGTTPSTRSLPFSIRD